jgi:hypothetical protein
MIAISLFIGLFVIAAAVTVVAKVLQHRINSTKQLYDNIGNDV